LRAQKERTVTCRLLILGLFTLDFGQVAWQIRGVVSHDRW
jgi:hypothetical protein